VAEWWPLDFVFETLWPFELQDKHTYHYRMVPMAIPNTEEILRRSGDVRGQGRSIRAAEPPQTDPALLETTGAPPDGEAPAPQMPREEDR
jgi:hypothetical protein